jgi:hypothetical protein
MLSLRGPKPSFKAAVGWARLGLPTLHGRRRKVWVARAVEEANTRLQQAEAISEQLLRQRDMNTEEFMWQ